MNEEMVENEQFESAADDTQQAQTAEEEVNGVMALSDLLGHAGEETENAEEQTEESQDPAETEMVQQKPAKENGGLKGRLLAENKKGYEAGKAAALKEWQQKEADYQARISRLEQYELRERAAKIAKEQNVSDDIAMFLARNGFGSDDTESQPQTKPAEKPRDPATGRFVSNNSGANQQSAPSVDERASVLFEQAQNIKRMTGVDAIELYKKASGATQSKIADGTMDLYDLVRDSQTAQKRTPPNIRTNTSYGTGGGINFGNMSDDDIDKLNAYMRRGGVVNTEL